MKWPDWHESRNTFSEALSLTARSTGFGLRLIEKDYYCSLLLLYLSSSGVSPLVFKGGTCLSKVHTEFFRLSEDLDFCVPQAPGSKRGTRRRTVAPLKRLMAELHDKLDLFSVPMPLTGRNESTQYIAEISYVSIVTGQRETIKVEIGLREPLFLPAVCAPAKTLLLNPVTAKPAVASFPLLVLDFREAMAEKTRAALARLGPAIRDWFDLDYARLHLNLHMEDAALVELIRKKLAVPGNGPLNLSEERRAELEKQVESQLRPVLRTNDFEQFDLDRIWTALVALADRLKEE